MESGQGLYVRFSLESRVDKKESLKEGREVWKNVEYIQIHVPGDQTNIPHRPVEDEDRSRFAKVYNAWRKGLTDVVDGQPLKDWPGITPAEVSMLSHSNMHTVEQLASVSDENASRIGPILHLRAKARAYMEAGRAQAPVQALTEKLERQGLENKDLREQLQQAMAAIQAMQRQSAPVPHEESPAVSDGEPPPAVDAAPKRPRGRPPKKAVAVPEA